MEVFFLRVSDPSFFNIDVWIKPDSVDIEYFTWQISWPLTHMNFKIIFHEVRQKTHHL